MVVWGLYFMNLFSELWGLFFPVNTHRKFKRHLVLKYAHFLVSHFSELKMKKKFKQKLCEQSGLSTILKQNFKNSSFFKYFFFTK